MFTYVNAHCTMYVVRIHISECIHTSIDNLYLIDVHILIEIHIRIIYILLYIYIYIYIYMIYNKFLKGNMIIHANHNKYDLIYVRSLSVYY